MLRTPTGRATLIERYGARMDSSVAVETAVHQAAANRPETPPPSISNCPPTTASRVRKDPIECYPPIDTPVVLCGLESPGSVHFNGVHGKITAYAYARLHSNTCHLQANL
jgi:hypothetical protein